MPSAKFEKGFKSSRLLNFTLLLIGGSHLKEPALVSRQQATGSNQKAADRREIVVGTRKGVCSTYLRLDTSTKCIKLFSTSPQTILGQTYFITNVYTNIIYNFL